MGRRVGSGAVQTAVAKLLADQAATDATRHAHQAHGAMGMTCEYPLHHVSRRLWAWRSEYGDERTTSRARVSLSSPSAPTSSTRWSAAAARLPTCARCHTCARSTSTASSPRRRQVRSRASRSPRSVARRCTIPNVRCTTSCRMRPTATRRSIACCGSRTTSTRTGSSTAPGTRSRTPARTRLRARCACGPRDHQPARVDHRSARRQPGRGCGRAPEPHVEGVGVRARARSPNPT